MRAFNCKKQLWSAADPGASTLAGLVVGDHCILGGVALDDLLARRPVTIGAIVAVYEQNERR